MLRCSLIRLLIKLEVIVEARVRHACRHVQGEPLLEGSLHQHFNGTPADLWAEVPRNLGETLQSAGEALGELADSTLTERQAVAKELQHARWVRADLDHAHHAAHDAAFRAALHRPTEIGLHDAAFKYGLGGKPPPGAHKVKQHKAAAAAQDERLAQVAGGTPPASPTSPRSPSAKSPTSPPRSPPGAGPNLQARRLERRKTEKLAVAQLSSKG